MLESYYITYTRRRQSWKGRKFKQMHLCADFHFRTSKNSCYPSCLFTKWSELVYLTAQRMGWLESSINVDGKIDARRVPLETVKICVFFLYVIKFYLHVEYVIFVSIGNKFSCGFVHIYSLTWPRPKARGRMLKCCFFFYVCLFGHMHSAALLRHKPWNHLHMCTVVLWTRIVVEFMFLYGGFSANYKETGEQNAKRVALNVWKCF